MQYKQSLKNLIALIRINISITRFIFTENIPDALQNGCVKCSEFQRRNTKKIVNYILKEKRPWFDELEQKYDPQRNYRKKFAEEIKREGILLEVD